MVLKPRAAIQKVNRSVTDRQLFRLERIALSQNRFNENKEIYVAKIQYSFRKLF